jgi:ribosomal-protein-alanine N-acetyltransferase
MRTSEAGRGFMTRAVRLVLDFGFNDLGLQRVEIFMHPDNISSKRVAEKVGGQFEGVLRKRIPWPSGNVDALGYSVLPPERI